MGRYFSRTHLIAAVVALLAVIGLSIYASDQHNNTAPVAKPKLAPAVSCDKLLDVSTIEDYTHTRSLHLNKAGGNSDSVAPYASNCDYVDANGAVVAQTSSYVLSSHGQAVYRAMRDNDPNSSVVASRLLADQLPWGVDDGYRFTPKKDSIYKNAGQAVRVRDHLVVLSFKGFNEVPDNRVKPLFNYALTHVFK